MGKFRYITVNHLADKSAVLPLAKLTLHTRSMGKFISLKRSNNKRQFKEYTIAVHLCAGIRANYVLILWISSKKLYLLHPSHSDLQQKVNVTSSRLNVDGVNVAR